MSSLTLQILEDNISPINRFEYFPGEDVRLRAQIIDAETGQQFVVPELGRSLSLVMPGNRNNIEIENEEIDVDEFNGSIFSTEIDGDVTAVMSSGNFKLVMDYYEKLSAPNLSAFTTVLSSKLTIDGTNYSFSTNGSSVGTFTTVSITGMELGQIGVITSSSDTTGIEVVVESVAVGSPSTVSVKAVNQITRIAQLQNSIKRLNPTPSL